MSFVSINIQVIAIKETSGSEPTSAPKCALFLETSLIKTIIPALTRSLIKYIAIGKIYIANMNTQFYESISLRPISFTYLN